MCGAGDDRAGGEQAAARLHSRRRHLSVEPAQSTGAAQARARRREAATRSPARGRHGRSRSGTAWRTRAAGASGTSRPSRVRTCKPRHRHSKRPSMTQPPRRRPSWPGTAARPSRTERGCDGDRSSGWPHRSPAGQGCQTPPLRPGWVSSAASAPGTRPNSCRGRRSR